jgi:hypothetical protein
MSFVLRYAKDLPLAGYDDSGQAPNVVYTRLGAKAPFRAVICLFDNREEVDTLSRERRSWNMSRIRGRDTAPELVVRSILHRLGCRFRLHVSSLPGRPDIVLPKHGVVVQCRSFSSVASIDAWNGMCQPRLICH